MEKEKIALDTKKENNGGGAPREGTRRPGPGEAESVLPAPPMDAMALRATGGTGFEKSIPSNKSWAHAEFVDRRILKNTLLRSPTLSFPPVLAALLGQPCAQLAARGGVRRPR